MRIKSVLKGLTIACLLGGCASPKYLPAYDAVDMSEYGSRITVEKTAGQEIKGELIAIDSNSLIILADSNYIKRMNSTIIIIPRDEVQKFRLRYARSKNFGWTIPFFGLATFSHGYYLVISAPVNLIITTAITVATASQFEYNEKEMTWERLKMFARFPQGIPPGINVNSLK